MEKKNLKLRLLNATLSIKRSKKNKLLTRINYRTLKFKPLATMKKANVMMNVNQEDKKILIIRLLVKLLAKRKKPKKLDTLIIQLVNQQKMFYNI